MKRLFKIPRLRPFILFLYTIIIAGPLHSENLNPGPSSVLFKNADFKVRQFVVPGFEELPLNRKLFVYYLTEAIRAGRDIHWIQDSRHGLDVRNFLEEVWPQSKSWPKTERDALADYMFKLYGNHSAYDYKGNFKTVIDSKKLSKENFLSHISKMKFSNDAQKLSLQKLGELLFDPEYQANFIDKSDSQNSDQIKNSNSNYYGIDFTEADYLKLSPEIALHPMNYPVKKADGSLDHEVFKIGGRFSTQLAGIHYYLKQALQYATESEKKAIEAMMIVLETGEPLHQKYADAYWVQNKSEDIEFNLGFTENYRDPKGIRRTWEGFVMLMAKDSKTKDRTTRTRANADYFESQMPVDTNFQKAPGFTPPQSEGAYTIFSGGEAGERMFSGVNLPNDSEVTSKFGTKSYGNLNIMTDINAGSESVAQLKSWLPKQYHEWITAYKQELMDITQVEFHEILGHGSGRMQGKTKESDLQDLYTPLEEMRAETASLYHLLDYKVVELGILPQMTHEQFEQNSILLVSTFFAYYIENYKWLSDNATNISQAHRRGAQVMMNWLLKDGAISIQLVPNEYPHVLVHDIKKVRKSLGRLWKRVQLAKSTGNYKLAQELFSKFDKYRSFHRHLRRIVIQKQQEEQVPKEMMTLNPRLKLVTDSQGQARDVVLIPLPKNISIEGVIDRQILAHQVTERTLQTAIVGRCSDLLK